MKPLLKLAAKLLFLLMTASAQAATVSINAAIYLTDGDGNVAIIWVTRASDPTTSATNT